MPHHEFTLFWRNSIDISLAKIKQIDPGHECCAETGYKNSNIIITNLSKSYNYFNSPSFQFLEVMLMHEDVDSTLHIQQYLLESEIN